MKFHEILSKLTGISCPVFGISWEPSIPERSYAKELVANIENRRLFFGADCRDEEGFLEEERMILRAPKTVAYGAFMPYSVYSATETRHFISSMLSKLPEKSILNNSARSIRRSCTSFVANVEPLFLKQDIILDGTSLARKTYYYEKDILLKNVGQEIGRIVIAYGIEEIDDELGSIIIFE